MQTGIVFDIQHNSFVDGPGIRSSVFFKGCNMRCSWCHNPESQKFAPELMVFPDKCSHCGKCERICPNGSGKCTLCGRCANYCPNEARRICGTEYSTETVMSEIRKYKIFFNTSGGGVTFSGGECMLQLDFLKELLMLCKKENIHTAVDTAGNVPYSNFTTILPWTDLVLYDIKSMNPDIHRVHTGCDNQLIMQNLVKLLSEDVHIWVRMPIIPGINDNDYEIRTLADFLNKNGIPDQVELLPYHRMGENKYPAIGRATPNYDVPDDENLHHLKQLLKLSLRVGKEG